MPALPPNFVDISTALSSQGYISVIGVVVDILPKFQSGGSSAVITFTLKDSEFGFNSWEGLKIKYFNDKMSSLPDVQLHDVVILRNIRVRFFKGKKMAVATDYEKIPWAIFRHELGSSPITGPVRFEPTPLERKYARALLKRVAGDDDDFMPQRRQRGQRREQEQQQQQQQQEEEEEHPPPTPAVNYTMTVVAKAPAPKAASTGFRPFALIKDLKPGTFVDLMGQIVQTYGNDSEKYLIYVCDYTTNKALLDYGQGDGRPRLGDEHGHLDSFRKKWTGPKGQMILQVTLWEPHASYAREFLKLNDFVILTNVHVKIGRADQKLEASVHTDRRWPDKIHVDTVDAEEDPRARELLQRKREYWKRNRANLEPRGENDGAGTSKSKKRKIERQRKKQEAKVEEGQKSLASAVISRRYQRNDNIQCRHPGVRPLTVEDILSNESHNNVSPDGINYRLPFQNICYRSFVRVVDFFPPNLEDFSVPTEPEYAALSDSGSDPDDNADDAEAAINGNSSSRRIVWEWRFYLVVESASPLPPGQTKEQMILYVSGHDAVHLLKLDAVDLRRYPQRLAELRERLFILWGDLEEQKKKSADENNKNNDNDNDNNETTNPNPHPPDLLKNPASSLPFTCCIKEYGVKCSHEYNKQRSTQGQGQDYSNIDCKDKVMGCSHPDCFGWEKRFAMFGTTINV